MDGNAAHLDMAQPLIPTRPLEIFSSRSVGDAKKSAETAIFRFASPSKRFRPVGCRGCVMGMGRTLTKRPQRRPAWLDIAPVQVV
jgi:hypothetical protein